MEEFRRENLPSRSGSIKPEVGERRCTIGVRDIRQYNHASEVRANVRFSEFVSQRSITLTSLATVGAQDYTNRIRINTMLRKYKDVLY